MPFRRERTSTTQARKGMMFILRQLAVFSKACVQTWMGEYFFSGVRSATDLSPGLAPVACL